MIWLSQSSHAHMGRIVWQIFFDKFFDKFFWRIFWRIFLTKFCQSFWRILYLLTIASFRIGVPSILLYHKSTFLLSPFFCPCSWDLSSYLKVKYSKNASFLIQYFVFYVLKKSFMCHSPQSIQLLDLTTPLSHVDRPILQYNSLAAC